MSVAYDFAGRTAVVAGGAGAIGRAIVDQLANAGADVWVWDTASSQSSGVGSATVDVTDAADVAAGLARILDEVTTIDIVVNSAGYLGPHERFDELPPPEWRRIIDTNLLGVLQVCHAVVPHMRRAGRGRIVNIGSLAGKQGLADLAVYSAASAGVIAFTKALAAELADTEVRVNCVAPGPIETELITGLGPEVVSSMIQASPLRRLGSPEEVAGLVLWLCSDASSFNSGAVFDASGGRAGY